jgi:hypothetical protein
MSLRFDLPDSTYLSSPSASLTTPALDIQGMLYSVVLLVQESDLCQFRMTTVSMNLASVVTILLVSVNTVGAGKILLLIIDVQFCTITDGVVAAFVGIHATIIVVTCVVT